MAVLRKIARFAALAMAGLFIVLSLSGMFGVWWANHKATEIILKGFGLIETATAVADAGVARVDDLYALGARAILVSPIHAARI